MAQNGKGTVKTSEWGRNEDYQNSADLFSKMSGQNTGESGYNRSLGMAGRGAAVSADKAKAEAQSAARNAGMSQSQAAMMGANQTANAYANSFNAQQASAANQLNNQLSAQGQLMSSKQTEANNEHQRGWTNISNTADQISNATKAANDYLASGGAKALGDTVKNAWGGLTREFNPNAEEFAGLSPEDIAKKKKEFEANKLGDFLKSVGEVGKFATTFAPLLMSDETLKNSRDISKNKLDTCSDERLKVYYDITSRWE